MRCRWWVTVFESGKLGLGVGWIKLAFLLRKHRCCAQPALLPPLSPTIWPRGMMEADAPTGRCSSNRVLRPNRRRVAPQLAPGLKISKPSSARLDLRGMGMMIGA